MSLSPELRQTLESEAAKIRKQISDLEITNPADTEALQELQDRLDEIEGLLEPDAPLGSPIATTQQQPVRPVVVAGAPPATPAYNMSRRRPPEHDPAAPSVNVNLPRRTNVTSIVLGIIALVLGVLSLLVSWVPFLGVIGLPFCAIGLLLAGLGFLIALFRKGSGIGLPFVGGLMCGFSLFVTVGITSTVITGMGAALDDIPTNQTAVDETDVLVSEFLKSMEREEKEATIAPTPDEGEGFQTEVAGGTGAEKEEWALASTPVRQGDIQVEVAGVEVGKVVMETMFGSTTESDEERLSIFVDICNLDAIRKTEYTTWGGDEYSRGRDVAALSDNFGNTYKRVTYSYSREPAKRTESASLYPDKPVTDQLVFEVPLKTVEHLDLELPGENFGGTGMLRIRIPADMIEWKTTE